MLNGESGARAGTHHQRGREAPRRRELAGVRATHLLVRRARWGSDDPARWGSGEGLDLVGEVGIRRAGEDRRRRRFAGLRQARPRRRASDRESASVDRERSR
ncbi:hypothetical protein ZWY2020_045028, partial [Hordeum vulgare]